MDEKPVPSLLATLVERLAGQESLEVEFKSARGGLPQALWPTVSSFANTQGGWILLGIAEQADGLSIEGIENPDALLHNFHSQLRNEQKISHEICGTGDVTVEHLADKRIIVIRVPAAPRKLRPIYVSGNPYGERMCDGTPVTFTARSRKSTG